MIGLCFIRKGYGVVGKAFSSKSAYFCKDITRLSIIDYPFVPSPRNHGFSSFFAICLQSFCSNRCVYTLEFFLSTKETCYGDPRKSSPMIIDTLKQHLQSSFKVAYEQELGNLDVEVTKISSDDKPDSFEIYDTSSCKSTPRIVQVQNQVGMTPSDGLFRQVDTTNNFVHDINMQQNVIVGPLPPPELVQNVQSITHQQPIEELDARIPARDDATMEHNGNARDGASMEHNGNDANDLRKGGSACTLESASQITLEDLQQRSAMKLVDAAEDLGVSRSTLKGRCRDFGIRRWPPSKAGKFNQAINQQEIGQPSEKNTGDYSKSAATRLQGESCILVKATHGSGKKWVKLLLSARKMDLDETVATRFNLPIESFKIMYKDEEDDWISITCDEDLSISLSRLRSVGRTKINMLVCS